MRTLPWYHCPSTQAIVATGEKAMYAVSCLGVWTGLPFTPFWNSFCASILSETWKLFNLWGAIHRQAWKYQRPHNKSHGSNKRKPRVVSIFSSFKYFSKSKSFWTSNLLSSYSEYKNAISFQGFYELLESMIVCMWGVQMSHKRCWS